MNEKATIYFDLDGTLANLYGVENWLADLLEGSNRPYAIAKPLVNMSLLARRLNTLRKWGYRIGVISWTSKGGSASFNADVAETKRIWLRQHLPSVCFDEIHIVDYGTPKANYAHSPADILFDDEAGNRESWTGVAYDVDNILGVLAKF